MTTALAIADVASLLGEPARAAMLLALMEGRALAAGELARRAGISAAAASLHLAKLRRGGLLSVFKQGRHRYYSLAGAPVARALEALGLVATRTPAADARWLSSEKAALHRARTCYDHLAGQLGVGLREALEREGVLQLSECHETYAIPSAAERWLQRGWGIELQALRSGRRSLARPCLDWSARKPHLAGALGAALLDHMFAARWLRRQEGTRAVRVTDRGRRALGELGVPAEALEPARP